MSSASAPPPASALAGTAAHATHAPLEDATHRMLAASFFICVIAATLGIAGTFTPLMTGTSVISPSITTAVSISYQQTCLSCSSSTPLLCAGQPNICYTNNPISSSSFGSSQLTAGLSFSVMAWILELIALPAIIACVAETTNSALASGALLRAARLPLTTWLGVFAVVFRCIALGCGLNYVFSQLLNPNVPAGVTYSSQSNAGLILSFIALGFSAILVVLLWWAQHNVKYAIHHPAKSAVVAHVERLEPTPARVLHAV